LEGNNRLGQWVCVQRYFKGKLSAERKQRLDAIGFVWDWRDYLWEQNFAALLKFKRREGHCCIPTDYRKGNFQTWVVDCDAAQKSKDHVTRTKGAFEQPRLCVESRKGSGCLSTDRIASQAQGGFVGPVTSVHQVAPVKGEGGSLTVLVSLTLGQRSRGYLDSAVFWL
jgi:hypothetical protein